MNQKENINSEFGNEPKLTLDIVKELWTKTYNTAGKPDWSHILPYYDKEIYFRDSIQELKGMAEFEAMTERLTKRSKDLKMKLIRVLGVIDICGDKIGGNPC